MGNRARLTAATLAVLAVAATATAGGPVPKGQRAVLEYAVEVEGKASATDKIGQYQHWSTRRSLVVRSTLVAQPATAQDPGEPPGRHGGAKRAGQAAGPPPGMAAMAAAMQKCGEDMACKMAVAQKMEQDPQFQAEMQRMKAAAQGPPRYQTWYRESRAQATGTVKVEGLIDQMFKTAVNEYRKCREHADVAFETLPASRTWPVTFRFDTQAGTYAATVGELDLVVLVATDCGNRDERGRTADQSRTGHHFLPEGFRQGQAEAPEVFRGQADAAAGGRRIAHGEKVFDVTYGRLIEGVPQTARATIRWTLTLVD